MGTLLVLSTVQIITIFFLIAIIGVIIYCFTMSPKWKKEDEEREKNKPDLCKEGDYLLGQIVAESWYTESRGWIIKNYGRSVKGYVENYRRDVNCVKIYGEWYEISDKMNGLSINKIIPMNN
jgi:hypothetical protein